MKIVVDLQKGRLSFKALPQDLDGSVCPDTVWFSVDGPMHVQPARLALMGYLLFEDSIGNVLEFEGVALAPHVGNALGKNFGLAELFIGGIENTAHRILPHDYYANNRFLAAKAQVPVTDARANETLQFESNVLGYGILGPDRGSNLDVATNLDLRICFLQRDPVLLTGAILLLLAAERLKVYRLLAGDADSTEVDDLRVLLQEVGLGINFDRTYVSV